MLGARALNYHICDNKLERYEKHENDKKCGEDLYRKENAGDF